MNMNTRSPSSMSGRYDDDYVGKKTDMFLAGVKCVIFGFDGQQLKVLLIKGEAADQKDNWSLLSGFINKGESAEGAVSRILECNGIQNVFLEQLHCFGGFNYDASEYEISIAYLALVKISDYNGKPLVVEGARWFSCDEIHSFFFQHREIVARARARIKEKVLNYPLGVELLPSKFTLTQLQNLYEAIYEVSFDRSNFSKKILSFGFLKKLNEKEKLDSRRGSYYYAFDKSNYRKRERKNINFDWR